MTERQEDELWKYGREVDDFPSPGRGYHEEEELPIASDDADNECGGVLGADGHIYSDADPGL